MVFELGAGVALGFGYGLRFGLRLELGLGPGAACLQLVDVEP